MTSQIAVLGVSSLQGESELLARSVLEDVVRIAKQHRSTLLTGTGGGVSTLLAKVAAQGGIPVVGISPATDAKSHIELTGEDPSIYATMIYTGMGYKGRNVTLVRSADVVVALGGQTGTLNELTIAWDEGKRIAIGQDGDALGCAPAIFRGLVPRVSKKARNAELFDAPSVACALDAALISIEPSSGFAPATDSSIEDLFRQAGAISEGHFAIKSGHHTIEFWEKARLLAMPDLVADIARRMASIVKEAEAEVLIGPPIGGAILAHAVGLHCELPALFFDKGPGGEMLVLRGYSLKKGARALIVDDIVSVGGTIASAEAAIESLGLQCVGSLVIVDRRGGSPRESLAELKHPLRALLVKDTPRNESPDDCSACKQGVRFEVHKERLALAD